MHISNDSSLIGCLWIFAVQLNVTNVVAHVMVPVAAL